MTIKIEGEGLTFNLEITMHQAGQIISFLSLAKPLQATQSNLDTANISILPEVIGEQNRVSSTPIDEINEAKAITFAQKITVIGSYLMKRDGKNYFLIDDVRSELKKLGQFPSSFSRELKAAEHLRYIYEESKDGGYKLTELGKNSIQAKFSSESSSNKINKKKKNATKKAIVPQIIRGEVQAIEPQTSMENFNNFYSCKTKREKILWILKFAEINGVSSLNPKEISFLSSKLSPKFKDQITIKAFSALNQFNLDNGYVAYNGKEYQIQEAGENNLKNILVADNNGNK